MRDDDKTKDKPELVREVLQRLQVVQAMVPNLEADLGRFERHRAEVWERLRGTLTTAPSSAASSQERRTAAIQFERDRISLERERLALGAERLKHRLATLAVREREALTNDRQAAAKRRLATDPVIAASGDPLGPLKDKIAAEEQESFLRVRSRVRLREQVHGLHEELAARYGAELASRMVEPALEAYGLDLSDLFVLEPIDPTDKEGTP